MNYQRGTSSFNSTGLAAKWFERKIKSLGSQLMVWGKNF